MREFLSDPVINLIVATLIGIVSNIITGKLLDRRKRLWWGAEVRSLRTEIFNEFNKEGKLKVFHKAQDGYHEVTNSCNYSA